jgi:hypothetical protein
MVAALTTHLDEIEELLDVGEVRTPIAAVLRCVLARLIFDTADHIRTGMTNAIHTESVRLLCEVNRTA